MHEKMFNIIVRKMQIKTKMKYHLLLVRMAAIKMPTNNTCWWECGEKRTHIHWECKLVQPLSKIVWGSLTKLTLYLPFSYSTSGYLSKEYENTNSKDICTPMFIIWVLFKIESEWIKMWRVHTHTHTRNTTQP